MSSREKKQPLTQQDLESIAITLNLEDDSDSEIDYESDQDSNDSDHDIILETTSEMEDNLEVKSEEEYDAKPMNTEFEDCWLGPKYTSGIQWES